VKIAVLLRMVRAMQRAEALDLASRFGTTATTAIEWPPKTREKSYPPP